MDWAVRRTQACFLEVIRELKLRELSYWSSRYYMAGSKSKKMSKKLRISYMYSSHTCMIIASWADPGFFNGGV